MTEKKMNNVRAVMALNDLKVYASSHSLDALDYAIAVLEKLEEEGIKQPLVSLEKEK
ncbi:hypothetical protein [Fibrobacter sp. UWEL]|uniref:hypothetical protein n=1 Tax=Fibrobacter sp. UWEL TaxID=1896209 RepID=UPI000911D36F|nr:hypothetical protein [Fibrobacter sp. UWEL]SHK60619.1 hypothetical protein SAMN05720468_10430 [Fibrobacter sp. UWEL]